MASSQAWQFSDVMVGGFVSGAGVGGFPVGSGERRIGIDARIDWSGELVRDSGVPLMRGICSVFSFFPVPSDNAALMWHR